MPNPSVPVPVSNAEQPTMNLAPGRVFRAASKSVVIATLLQAVTAAEIRLRHFARRLFGRYADRAEMANDAFQELQLLILRGGARGWDGRNARSYLFGILKNVCALVTRRRRRQHQLPEAFEEEDHGHDPCRQASVVEARAAVRRCLPSLPAAQREAILAAFWEGLSLKQYARRTGQALGTVSVLRSRGYAQLRRMLQAYADGSS